MVLAEERQLEIWWSQYKKTQDSDAREQLVLAYLYLVKYVAGRMAVGLASTVDYDDLVSYGISVCWMPLKSMISPEGSN